MFCPNCGERNSTDQKFCRSCGLNLEKSIESLLEQLPDAHSANLLKQSKMLERYGNFAFGGFITVLALAVSILIYTIVVKMVLSGSNVISGLMLCLFIVFAILTLIYVFLNESLKEKKGKAATILSNELENKASPKQLEERSFEIVPPSVTERTTDLLFAEKRKITDELG